MIMFEALNISGSALNVHQTWLDAISDNIANVNTVRSTDEEAYRARYVMATPRDNGGTGAGVAVAGIELGDAEGRVAHSPDHPLADEDGNIRLPDIDLGSEMTSMIMAQRGYQASIASLERVRTTYREAIKMGRS
jgi:flagellar basal-body rod protein FlgC